MKLLSLLIIFKNHNNSEILQATYELSSYGYFQRSSVQEFLDFTAKIVCERTLSCQRSQVTKEDSVCHVYVRQDNLCGVCFSDIEYPPRVAQTLLTKILDEFTIKYPSSTWPTISPKSANLPQLSQFLGNYQNPNAADSLYRLQNDVQDTTEILQQTLEKLFQRGEKLDDLVSQSEDLSMQSKAFYKTAKKTNSCCTIL